MTDTQHSEEDRLFQAHIAMKIGRKRLSSLSTIIDQAVAAFDAEMATVSILERTDQHFLGSRGLAIQSTHRAVAFCDHTIRREGVLHVPDATADVRFQFNPLVLCSPNIRSYLGAPISYEGRHVGALCVISPRRGAFDDLDSEIIVKLAREATQLLAA